MTPIEWMMSGDTGISSKTICAVMTGCRNIGGADLPHDPDDFGRCYRLLILFPEWRPHLQEVADIFPIWGPMVRAWDELTELYREEIDCSIYPHIGSAPKLYARMLILKRLGRSGR